MEDDLINMGNALKLIEDIKLNQNIPKNYGTLLDIIRAIRKLPTAYDVDSVVERLKEKSEYCKKYGDADGYGYRSYEEAIEIVKSGGESN